MINALGLWCLTGRPVLSGAHLVLEGITRVSRDVLGKVKRSFSASKS